MKHSLSGRRRKLTSFIQPFEQYILRSVVPRVPRWLETYHLTLLSIPFSVGVVAVGYLARTHISWIMLIALLIFLQYVTDILDGAVGRYRNTGLISWGFYMDHLMDYIFACSQVIAFIVALRLSVEFFMLALLITSAFFIHEFLMCVIEGQLNTSGYFGFGPTELRFIVMLSTLVVPFVSKEILILFVTGLFPVSFFILVWLIFRAHRILWKLDMEKRSN